MIDEIALLLTLLDRPCDAEARLVYADWVEDDGQDDLAQWLRLHAELPHLLAGSSRRHHEQRLRDLYEAHRKDWVDVGGTLLSWRSALLLLRHRLAETIAWCAARDFKVLRTPELMPHLPHRASAIEPLWRSRRHADRTGVVHRLGQLRAAQLSKLDPLPDQPLGDLAGGRLLLFNPDTSEGNRLATLIGDGFIDAYLAPAWDTWIAYFDDGPDGHRRAHAHWEAEWIVRRQVEPVPFPTYLVAWVPPTVVSAVDWVRTANGRVCLNWADNVDCELSTRLREAGWFAPPKRLKVEDRIEKRIGIARREPRDQRGPI